LFLRVVLFFICVLGFNSIRAQHNVRILDLLNELRYAKHDTTKIDIFINLAKEYGVSDVTKAISKAELGLTLAQHQKDVNRSFDATAILAEIYFKKYDIRVAAKYLAQAQGLNRAKLTLAQTALLHGLEGQLYLALGDIEKSQIAFQTQLKIYEKDSKWAKSLDIAKTYFSLGELYFLEQSISNAIGFYTKSLDIVSKTDDVYRRIECLNALGKAYLASNSYEKGLQFSNDALYLSESLNDKVLMSDIYFNAASALFAMSNVDEAIEKLEQAKSYAQSVNNHYVLAKVKILEGRIISLKGQKIKAGELYKEALDISWLSGNKRLTKEIYELLYAHFDTIDDIKNAHFYLKGLVAIKDSLRIEEQNKEMVLNKIKFETEEKEAENERLMAEQLSSQITIQRQRMSNYILITILLVGAYASYQLYQSWKKKKVNNVLLEQEVHRRTELLMVSNEELVHTNKKLEQSNAELERFAYIASHDLKSPLRNIISFANLIDRKLPKPQDKDLKEYLRFVTENAAQMNVLIQDVLEFSCIDTDASNLRKEKVDLNDTLMLAIQNLQEDIQQSNAEIFVTKLPSFYANSVHFLQVFQNIIGNAIKYNQAEQPKVEISHQTSGNQHIIMFKDNGIGIATQYHEQIFEMFKRLHTRDEYKGTGIGLAICKKIVYSLNGRIWLESEVGKGSTFYLSIPTTEGV
jgi:signal transduction histidine kinase/multidrug efflux pump subunit AcrA (membrane-fusion protein)